MSTRTSESLGKTAENFSIDGTFVSGEKYGFGHINDTYLLTFEGGTYNRYIMQRINTNVFKKPDELMSNITLVTKFLRGKIEANGGDPSRETLNVIPTKDGKNYYTDGNGDCFRMYIFIEDAITYQIAENPSHLYSAGQAFGNFQKLLGDFPAATLFETIPNFHNTKMRFDAFVAAVEADSQNRGAGASAEIDFAMKQGHETSVLVDKLAKGELPLRVTHNDTKFNNVMLDTTSHKAICVIDLDTVMPGLSLYDFGDSIRSGTNTAEEDERDLSIVGMDLNLFRSYTKGFLEFAGGFLTKEEVSLLAFSARVMTFECGIRFLADHLCGDTYFKIHRDGHNLDRARTQFKLVSDMERMADKMEKIILEYV